MTIDEIELVLLREIVENKSTCREAALKLAEWMETQEQSGYGVVKSPVCGDDLNRQQTS